MQGAKDRATGYGSENEHARLLEAPTVRNVVLRHYLTDVSGGRGPPCRGPGRLA